MTKNTQHKTKIHKLPAAVKERLVKQRCLGLEQKTVGKVIKVWMHFTHERVLILETTNRTLADSVIADAASNLGGVKPMTPERELGFIRRSRN